MRSFLFALLGGWIVAGPRVLADDPPVPVEGFSASRYEALWKKSPFSVATPESAPDSPDYSLVGIAEFDGVSYASVIDRKTQEHLLVSSDKPVNGLTLTNITRGHEGSDTTVVVQKDGQPLTLKLERAPLPTADMSPGAPPMPNVPPPGSLTPPIQIPMPGTTPATTYRPLVPRIHRSIIHLPPNPNPLAPPPQNLPSAPPK